MISTEVGQNQMWAAQYYHLTNPDNWLTSRGLGTMGYGFPAAMGSPGCQTRFPCYRYYRRMAGTVLPKNYSGTNMSPTPDFVKLAEVYGARGFRATTPDKVKAAIQKGLETQGPVIMEFMVKKRRMCIPWFRHEPPITNMLLV